jgi:hypothetical protein
MAERTETELDLLVQRLTRQVPDSVWQAGLKAIRDAEKHETAADADPLRGLVRSVTDDTWNAGLAAIRASTSPRPVAVSTRHELATGRQVGQIHTISRRLAAAAADGSRPRLQGRFLSADGRFETAFEETTEGRLLLTVRGPVDFDGLVTVGYTRPVVNPAPTPVRTVLVTPLATYPTHTRAVYDLGSLTGVSEFSLEPAELIDASVMDEQTIRAALQECSPFGNAVRAWRRYRAQATVPEALQALIDNLLNTSPR